MVAETNRSIGLLYIATGPYKALFPKFHETACRYFCPQNDKTFHVFTDDEAFFADYANVRITPIQHRPWPLNTLFRYRFFHEAHTALCKQDFLFFCNANVRFQKDIELSEIVSADSFVALVHIGHKAQASWTLPFERRRASAVRLGLFTGGSYVAGAFWGGPTGVVLDACKHMDLLVQRDYVRGIIPKWHDESVLNFYVRTVPCHLIDIWDHTVQSNGKQMLIKEKSDVLGRQVNDFKRGSDLNQYNEACASLDDRIIILLQALRVDRFAQRFTGLAPNT